MDRLYDDNIKVRIISDPHPSIGRLMNGFGSGKPASDNTQTNQGYSRAQNNGPYPYQNNSTYQDPVLKALNDIMGELHDDSA